MDKNTESGITHRLRGPSNLPLTATRNIFPLSIMTYYRKPHAHDRQDHPNIEHHSCFYLV